jgi:beta-glucanase (GH16 family)
MTFDDEFNGTSLNTAVWSTGMRWDAVINNELEGYVPSNVTVANGLCTLKVEKRTVNNTDMYGDVGQQQSYASGCLQTYTKWAQAYGYFEASIRMSPGLGTWPAFWLLPDRGSSLGTSDRVLVGNDGHGMGNEIDIVEFMSAWTGQNSQGLFESHSGYFWGYGSGQSWGNYGQADGGIGPVNVYSGATTGFHTYGVCWQPGSLVYYLDGKVILRRSDPTDIGTVPEYMILNCALSTNQWFGSPLTTAQIDSGLPCTMDIDYVHVYSGTAAAATKSEAENLTIPNYYSKVGGTARLIGTDANLSNSNGIILDSNNVGDYVTFLVPNVAAQTYDVTVGVKDYYSRGQFQLQIGRADNFSGTESSVGPVVDEYSANAVYAPVDLGSWTPGTTSDKWFRFNVVGKNSASTGTSYNYAIAIDYILLTPE